MKYLKIRRDASSQGVTARGGLLGLDLPAEELARIAGLVTYLWPILVRLLPLLDAELSDGRFYDGFEDDEVKYFSLKSLIKKVGKTIGKVAKGVGKVAKGVVQSGVLNFVPGIGPVAQAIGSTALGLLSPSPTTGQLPSAEQVYSTQPYGTATPLTQAVQTILNPATGVFSATTSTGAPIIRAQADAYVMKARDAFMATARKYGVKEGLRTIEREYPDIFEMFVTIADYAKAFPADADHYEDGRHGTYYDRDEVAEHECSRCNTKLSGWSGGKLPPGTFFRSNLVTASVRRDLGNQVYGEVHLGKMPFPLYIAGNNKDPRARIALAHELAHVATKLYKLPLAHGQVHDLGVFFATEGLPTLQAYERYANQS
jgi:hypothetical protein